MRTFNQLQEAIDGDGDIKLCSGTLVFTKAIVLSGKQLTFTCPNGGCVLDAKSNAASYNQIFRIQGETSNISFDGITFKNGGAIVSPKKYIMHSWKNSTYRILYRLIRSRSSTIFSYFWQFGGAIANEKGKVKISASNFVGNSAAVSHALIVHNLVVLCYTSNASFRTSSNTTACIVLLLCFW